MNNVIPLFNLWNDQQTKIEKRWSQWNWFSFFQRHQVMDLIKYSTNVGEVLDFLKLNPVVKTFLIIFINSAQTAIVK